MSLADKNSMPDPVVRAPVPPHLMAAVAEAFAIGRWTWDAESGEIELLGDTLDAHNAPRKMYSKSDARSSAMARLDAWLQGCKEGDSVTASFTLREDPVAVRVFCLGRNEKSAWGLLQDCTAETLGTESDRRFRMALMGAAHGIALVGLDGTWMQVNDALCKMLGYSEPELRALTFQDITHPDDLETDLDYLHECIEGKRTTYQMEKRYFRKDGETIWVYLAVSVLRAENNQPLYFISQIQDITARKQVEEQLVAARDEAKNASAAKSAFLASMSHEIRTPMTGVMGMLDMLAESGVSGEQIELIRTARSSAEMLLSIINDVLDMAKLEAGRVEIAKRDFNAEELLHTVCDMMAGRAEAKGLRFNAVLPLSTRIWLKGDPDRISQILFNILGNAVKFTDEGEVSLAAETRPTDAGLDLVVKVSDTGRGIPSDKTESIFREFERVQDEAGARVEGTGLGLAIVSRLIDAMGGRIEVTSELGRGSCFTIALPLAAGNAPAGAVAAPAVDATPSTPAGTPETQKKGSLAVLVVEDNAVNRKVIGSVLSIAGIEPVYAFDGQQALDAVKDTAFDVVFMDVMMPVMDGLTATKKLREMGFAAPILGLTANAMQHHREACFEAGMDDHIAKPFRPADILNPLKKHIGDHAIA